MEVERRRDLMYDSGGLLHEDMLPVLTVTWLMLVQTLDLL